MIGYRTRCFKNCFQKVVHKAAEATGEFIGIKIASRIVKSDENPRKIEEIVIPPEKREEILNESRQAL